MGILKVRFTIGDFFNWRIQSENADWLNQNIREFKSAYQDVNDEEACDVLIQQVEHITVLKDALNVSEDIFCLSEQVYIKDKFSNKILNFKIEEHHFSMQVEKGFTFHYYAALLDGFIKIIAFKKGLVVLHASAIKKGNEVYVFGAWRRMGKTTTILNILTQDKTVQVLADDAVILTANGDIIPYIRGIDLYPYLPIPNSYLTLKDRLKRRMAKGFQHLPLLSKKLNNKIIKRFLLPRVNLAKFEHGDIKPVKINRYYSIRKHLKSQTEQREITEIELKAFIGRSSFFEIIEYQAIFEMVYSVYPESPFSKLLIDYKTFQDKVNHVISGGSTMLELNLSNDYSDISELGNIILR